MCAFVKVMSDSLRPHGLYSSWKSPGQNAGVSSLSLLQGIFPNQGSNRGPLHCRNVCLVMFNSLQPHGLHTACQSPVTMEYSRQEYQVGSHFLLQEVFPTQGCNTHPLCLLPWQVDSLPRVSPEKP